jgi:hypothetical protein
LLDTIRNLQPQIPLIAAKPVKAKIIRAERVTPITTGGLVSLPRDAQWRADFTSEMANFPVGMHDDVPDAFCHAMKAFTTAKDFKTPELQVMPGHLPTQSEADEALYEEMREQVEWESDSDFNRFNRGNW